MILHDLHVAGSEGLKHIHLYDGKIKAIEECGDALKEIPGEQHLSFTDAIVFPGLINSHDHLDFNLFPQLGNRIYSNYTEWGKDIHKVNKDVIKQVLKIPETLRVHWGIFKNLVNGFTTVINHGKKLEIRDAPITVIQDHHILHSPSFEKNWKWKLNAPFKSKKPFVIHIGEGTDQATNKEIDKVIRWNLFKRKIVGVHGVAMNEEQAEHFAGLVWCPVSNFFLLGKTAAIDRLKQKTKVVFGSDSTLTSSPFMWEHLRQAKNTGMMNDEELFEALTKTPAGLWGLDDKGAIEVNKDADIVIAKKKNNFFQLNKEDILLIIHDGKIRLLDESIAPQLNEMIKKDLKKSDFFADGTYMQGDFVEKTRQLALHASRIFGEKLK
jgi:hypothetical protein